MKIRRYTGKDAQEAMLKVKMDLGREAIILNTRKVRKKGLAGLFSKPLTEVLAAIDEDYGRSKRDAQPHSTVPTKYSRYTYTAPDMNKPEDDSKLASLEEKIKNMERLVENIFQKIQKKDVLVKEQDTLNENTNIKNAKKEERTLKKDSVLQSFREMMLKSEVEDFLADKIINKAKEHIKNFASIDETYTVLSSIVTEILGRPDTIKLREDGKPTVVIFIGPTGVGKTTTLAKLAADYSLNKGVKVGLITADTYRIAAVEQLKTYAEILNIKVTVIYSPSELPEAIKSHQGKDLILIDTAGRSYKNKKQFEELKALVNISKADEVYLVLSTAMSKVAYKEAINHYSFLNEYKLLFTKLDETPAHGIVLNARYGTGKSLSYFTVGQSVPDDIEIAKPPKIVRSLLGSI